MEFVAGGLPGGKDHDLAIAHAAGARDLHDLLDDFLDPRIVDPKADLDFGQERQGVFAPLVLVEIAFLTAEAFHFPDSTGFDRSAFQPFEHFFDQKRLNDGDNLLHG